MAARSKSQNLARGLEGGGVDVVGGERAVEPRQGGEEALVLVLGALDGGEDALGLDAAQHLLGGGLQELLLALAERPIASAVGAEHAAQVAVFHDRHAEEADLDGRGVVGQVAALGILEVHQQAVLDHGAEGARVGVDGGLDHAVGVGDQLLDLEVLAGIVEPEQHAGVELERPLQKIDREVDGVVDRLHGADGQALLVALARARLGIGGQRGRDEAEVARFVAQVADGANQRRAVLPPLPHHLGLQEHEVRQREEADEGGVRQGGLTRVRFGHAGVDRRAIEQRLERQGDRDQGQADQAAVEGDDERGQRVDQRIDGRLQAARQLQRDIGGDDQRGAELEVALEVAAGVAAARLGRGPLRRLVGAGGDGAQARGDLGHDQRAERAGRDDGPQVRRRRAEIGEVARADERGAADGSGGAPQVDGDATDAPQEAPQLEAEQHQRDPGGGGAVGSAT